MPSSQQETLQKIKAAVENELVSTRFNQAVDIFTAFIAKLGESLVSKIDARLAQVKDGAKGEKGDKGDKGDTGQSIRGAKGDKGDKGDQGAPGATGRAIFGGTGDPGKDGSPDTPEQVRDKLETLPESDKLSIEAIRDLRAELDALKKGVAQAGTHSIAYSRGQIKLYDLSAQLNGVLSTFSLPSFWRVLQVNLSSAPNALRPTVDYTTNAAAATITFTSEIVAAAQLATGQTATVLYAEP